MTSDKTSSPYELPNDAAKKRGDALFAQGRYAEALDICLKVTRVYPGLIDGWVDAAINCVKLARWQEAVEYAQTALLRGGNAPALYSALACAQGQLGQWGEARRHGLEALTLRSQHHAAQAPIPLSHPAPPPPPPSAATRACNVIAFPLFGNDSRYCETAMLNAQEQPRVYPDWICRFYADDSVPAHVIDRLRASGGQVSVIAGPAARWFKSMRRLLALDDPQAHRVLFRDADTVISPREAGAVAQWVASGQRFHMMRDWGSHTQLMMPGLWGAVAGSLPPLEDLLAHFMRATRPEPERFTEQNFLNQYVWPHARASLMQHDSVFGFMNPVDFPDGERPESFHVGCADDGSLVAQTNLPDGTEVTWTLYRIEQQDDVQLQERLVCFYPATVKNGAITARIPDRYVQLIGQGAAHIRVAHARPAG